MFPQAENLADGMATWGLIGPGNIGTELRRQLGQDYVSNRLALSRLPEFVLRSSGVFDAAGEELGVGAIEEFDELPDVTFVAMPSTDDGKAAYDYISHILDRGKIAITAEKGALANNFDDLRDRSDEFRRLGVNATDGGGTRLLDVAQMYATDIGNISQVHLSLNGTLSAVMSMVAPPEGLGMSLGQAVDQSIRLGYAEPGATTPYEVIKQEAEADIPKKTAIFFNRLALGETSIDWTDLKFDLTNSQIAQVVEEAKIRRFIVSIYANNHLANGIKCPEDDIVGGFSTEHEDWKIVGGFRHVERNPLFAPLANVTGPGAGLVIGLGPNESDGVYSLTGPGAGVSPTVNTMIDDYVARR
ncbi:MAG TPA: hypothetical protein VHC21_04020 [Candidatus Saccharimonadales bacterium]|nr:hypothetical protein [Candidatus Saccharimonadales bacterium]